MALTIGLIAVINALVILPRSGPFTPASASCAPEDGVVLLRLEMPSAADPGRRTALLADLDGMDAPDEN